MVSYQGSSYIALKETIGQIPTNTEYWDLIVEKGDTPQKGIDYFTEEDIASLNIPSNLSDLTDDSTHRTVTDEEKTTWNNKIGSSDYAGSSTAGVLKVSNGVYLSSTGYISCYVREYADYPNLGNGYFISKGTLENALTGKNIETANNKVTTISSNSTDTQYPSAKCVYDLVGNIETILTTLDIGGGI